MFPENPLNIFYFREKIKSKNHKVSLVKKQTISQTRPQWETPLCASEKPASLTVEAAFVLPICVLLFVCILSIFRIYYTQLCLDKAMCNVTGILCMQGYATQKDASTEQIEAEDDRYWIDVLETAEVAVLLRTKIDQTVLNYISGGTAGLVCHCNIGDQEVSLCAAYFVTLPISYFGKRTFLIRKEITGRIWSGYSYAATETDEDIVYITPTGEVYHRSQDCTYLQTKLKAVGKYEISILRNADGGKYYACESCTKEQPTQVIYYIAEYGNRYHTGKNCTAIERTIISIPITEVGGRRACSKCGGSE